MNIKTFTYNEFKRYCEAEGSQYIVSEFALFQILNLIKSYRIKHILEVGVGIGTISGSILKYARLENFPVNVSGTEANSFCVNQIPLNLKQDYNRLKLFRNLKNIPNDEQYELIIIDGVEENIRAITKLLKPRGIIVVEGDRAPQVNLIRKIFPQSKYVHLISITKNGEYSVQKIGDYQGGLKIIFTDPGIYQNLHWLKLKVSTKLKVYIRQINRWTKVRSS